MHRVEVCPFLEKMLATLYPGRPSSRAESDTWRVLMGLFRQCCHVVRFYLSLAAGKTSFLEHHGHIVHCPGLLLIVWHVSWLNNGAHLSWRPYVLQCTARFDGCCHWGSQMYQRVWAVLVLRAIISWSCWMVYRDCKIHWGGRHGPRPTTSRVSISLKI